MLVYQRVYDDFSGGFLSHAGTSRIPTEIVFSVARNCELENFTIFLGEVNHPL